MKYQLTCPKCKYEFEYNNGELDKRIAKLGIEIMDINNQLAEHNLLPFQTKMARTDWWRRAKASLAAKQKELAELKAFRKVSDQQIREYEYAIFKTLVKEEIGENRYIEMLEKMKKELEAYKASGLMWHEYSKSKSKKSIISINKI